MVARKKQTAAEYIDDIATYVGMMLSELAENAGRANSAWMRAVDAARRGDLDRAETLIIEADIAVDIPVRIERQDIRRAWHRALVLLDRELPDDDEGIT
jgi:hypothetical protein